MATSATSANVEPGAGEPLLGKRPSLLQRSRKRIPAAVWYALGALGAALLIVVAQVTIYVHRSEPRDARAIVERELRMNTLRPGERVLRSVRVFRRNGTDYFRRTRGLLVLTDQRLIYLGAPPRDVTGSSDAPPTFDQREFRIDSLVRLAPSFTVLGLARAIKVKAPEGDVLLGIPSGNWPQAQLMRQAWDARHRRIAALGVWGGRVREARAHIARELEEYRKRPTYHVVRPGDALASIASWYETTPEEIQRQNGIVGNKIKVGQQLIIKPGS